MSASDAPAGTASPEIGCWGRFDVNLGDFRLDLSFTVAAGAILVLFGPSGAGKTTALRTIAGLARPHRGRISIAGRTVYADGEQDEAPAVWLPPHRRGVGYVTQQNHLFPHLTVRRNIAYGLRDRRGPAARRRVDELIHRLRLTGLEERRVWQLSGGQQQRAALARALAPAPDLLLLDEPFAALDMELRREVGAELRAAVRQLRVPVILVTHSREEALALGDTVQIIEGGRTVAVGPPLTALEQPGQGLVARLVGVENLLEMRVAARLPQDGTMVCISDAGSGARDWPGNRTLETPLADGCAVGDTVTVGIRASDIILASGPLPQSSARNTWAGVVSGVDLRPPGYEVSLDCDGIVLRCHITGASLEAMNMEPGQPLWAIFKASSCFLLSE